MNHQHLCQPDTVRVNWDVQHVCLPARGCHSLFWVWRASKMGWPASWECGCRWWTTPMASRSWTDPRFCSPSSQRMSRATTSCPKAIVRSPVFVKSDSHSNPGDPPHQTPVSNHSISVNFARDYVLGSFPTNLLNFILTCQTWGKMRPPWANAVEGKRSKRREAAIMPITSWQLECCLRCCSIFMEFVSTPGVSIFSPIFPIGSTAALWAMA